MKSLEAELKSVRKNEEKILRAIDERNKNKTIPCACCKTQHPIHTLAAIQTHFYIQPHGHTEGDYWKPGELQFICPTSGIVNRLLFDNNDVPWEARDEFTHDPEAQFKRAYKPLFASVKDVHDEKPMAVGTWVNNDYVDKHRVAFGLVEKRT